MMKRFLSARSAVVAIAMLVPCAVGSAPAHAITGERAVALTKVLMDNCIKEMTARQSSSGLTPAAINGYCSCTATSTVTRLTDDDYVLYLKTEGKGTVQMQDRNTQIVRECTKKFIH